MTTRHGIQIARDLIKFTNVANDLFDSAVLLAKGQVVKPGVLGKPGTSMTVEETKQQLIRTLRSIKSYNNLVLNFLDRPDNLTKAANGLSAWGVNVQSILDDNCAYKSLAELLPSAVDSAQNQSDLNAIADSIASSVEPLPLVRKASIEVGG